MNFETAIELYIEGYRHRHAAQKTINANRLWLRRFAQWCQRRKLKNPQQVTLQTLLDYYRWVRRNKKMGVLHINAHIQSVRRFFKLLAQHHLILEDIGRDFPPLHTPKRIPRGVLSEAQAIKLLQEPTLTTPLGFRDRAMLELLYSTGLRGSELCDLLLHDLDLPARMLRVIRGKGGKDRIVPVGKVAAEYVGEYLKSVRPILVNGNALNVFLSASGKALDAKNLLVIFKAYRDKAHLPDHLTTHSLRHTCATELLKGGASIRHVQELLGHSSITTTQMYTHVVPVELKKVHARSAPSERRKEEDVFFSPDEEPRWRDFGNVGCWNQFKPKKKVKKASKVSNK